MSGSREKMRAILLSFVMVISIMGAGVAFSGSVSAAEQGPSDQNVVEGAAGQTVTVGITETNGGNEITPSGTAKITLPKGSLATFNQSASALGITSNQENPSVSSITFDSPRQVSFTYSGLNDSSDNADEETITISNLAIDAPDGATDDITVDFAGTTATTTVNYKEPTVTLGTTDLNRGANSQQTGSSVSINADTTSGIDGQHAQNKNVTLSIPSSAQDEISFDKSQDIATSVTDDSSGSLGAKDPVFVDENTITFNVTGDDFDKSDTITVNSLGFNVSGLADANADATFESELNVTTVPVNAVNSNGIQSSDGPALDVETPDVELSDAADDPSALTTDVVIAPGVNEQDVAGVLITDDTGVGGAIGAGTNVTVEIPDQNEITFDTSQTLNVEKETFSGSTDAPTFVDNKTITFAVTGSPTSDGDEIELERDTDSKLKFNVTKSANAENVNLTVKTNASDAVLAQNTSHTNPGTDARIDVGAPSLELEGGSDLQLASGINNQTEKGGQPTFKLTSGADDDLIDPNTDLNITLTLGDGPVRFDQGQTLSDEKDGSISGNGVIANDVEASVVGPKTINVTTLGNSNGVGSAAIKKDDTIELDDVEFNITGNVNSTGISVDAAINASGVSFSADNVINTTVTKPTLNLNSGSDYDISSGIHDQQATGPSGGDGSYTLQLVSGDTGDLAEANQGKNVTISLPDGPVTFDKSQTASVSTDGAYGGSSSTEANIVDAQTLNVTTPQDEITGTNDIEIDGLSFNVTGNVNASSITPTAVVNTSSDVTIESQQVINTTVTKPSLDINAGNDLTLESDGDGETGVDPDASGTNGKTYNTGNANDIILTSGDDGDLAGPNGQAKNVSVTIPSSSPVTFDKSLTDSDFTIASGDGDLDADGDVDINVIGEREIVLTLTPSGDDNSEINAGSSVNIQGLQYNVSADASASDITFSASENTTDFSFTAGSGVNVTDVTPDTFRSTTTNDGTVGDTVTGKVTISNSSSVKEGSYHLFGGTDVNLNITSSPDAATVSNGDNLNDTTFETNSDGVAAFNLTLGDVRGDYDVTASLANNESINTTLTFSAGAGPVQTLNVTKVEDAMANDGSANNDAENAVFRVQVEDANGNINTSTLNNYEVDVLPVLSNGSRSSWDPNGITGGTDTGVAYHIDSDDEPANEWVNDEEGGGDGAYNYKTSEDATNKGVFYIFVGDGSAEPTTLQLFDDDSNINSGSASARFFGSVNSFDVSPNTTSQVTTENVKVTGVAKDSADRAITVEGGVSIDKFLSSKTSVLSRSSQSLDTNSDGEVTGTFSADSSGTADVTLIDNNIATATNDITVTNAQLAVETNVSEITLPASNQTVQINTTAQHDSEAVNGASVTINGSGVDKSGTTGADGLLNVSNVKPSDAGTIQVNATKSKYDMGQATIDVVRQSVALNLTANATTVTEDAPAYFSLKQPRSVADRAVQTGRKRLFTEYSQSGSPTSLPHNVYSYTRTHTGGLR